MRTVCAITGSRADYGLLLHPLRAIAASPDLRLQLAVTGMHLAPEFGNTVTAIEADGFEITHRVETQLSSDTAVGVAKSMALGLAGFADAFARDRPGMLLLLGDRFEMFAAASAALVAGIPMAHLCGGDVTEGAYDEAFRHGLTKMAHLHFPTNADAARRIVQLGEPPSRVHCVGSSGLDALRTLQRVPREALAADLGIDPARRWLLVTFHPATRDPGSPVEQLDALLAALEPLLAGDAAVIATLPNADNDGRALGTRLREWAEGRKQVHVAASLGQQRYLSAMSHAAAVVGNSSSGLYEAPSFAVPTVNIGTRQAGRPRATSVFDCAADRAAIAQALTDALSFTGTDVVNPYGDGHASERIVAVLETEPDWPALLAKSFHDLEVPA